MNRRQFFGLLSIGLAGFAIDPEQLLWTPGQRAYFLPVVPDWRIGAWMAHPANSLVDVLRLEVMTHPRPEQAYYGTMVRRRQSPALERLKAQNLARSMVEHIQQEQPYVSLIGLESRIESRVRQALRV